MIIVHINPAGVEQVYFQAGSELAEDLSMAVWPLVRKELNRLDKKLRKAAMTTLELVGEGPTAPDGAGR
jgi:hypothetical protein